MDNKPEPPPEKQGNDTLENVLKVAAYPVAGLAAFLVADNSIRKSSYKNFARHGVFDDIQNGRTRRFQEMVKELPTSTKPSVSQDVQRIESFYRWQVKQRFEEMGLYGLGDYWKTLHRDQKIDAFVMSATAAGIAIGAMLTIAHEKDWVKSLSENPKHDPEAEKAPSR